MPLLSGYSQDFDLKIFDKRVHKTKTEVKEKTQEYHRIQKDYKKYIKVRNKEYRIVKDSLMSTDSFNPAIPKDSLNKLVKDQKEYFIYTDSVYSLEDLYNQVDEKAQLLNRSVDTIKIKLSGNRHLSQFEKLKKEIIGYKQTLRIYKDSLSNLDSLDKEDLNYMVEQRKKELSKEYEGKLESSTREIVNEKAPDLPNNFQSEELAKFQEANSYLKEGLNQQAVTKLAKSQSIDHFKHKQEVLEKAKSGSTILKKTYNEVNDFYDLSTAKKSNSLQQRPFSQRLVFGGTFQLHMDENTKVDLNPELSYRINQKFDAGVGGTYRLKVASKDISQAVDDPDVMGLRGFLEHKLIKNFYVHTEYEGLKNRSFQEGDRPDKEWYFSFLAGLERRFKLKGKPEAQTQILYNFNSRQNPLNSSRWVFRLGFNVGGKK